MQLHNHNNQAQGLYCSFIAFMFFFSQQVIRVLCFFVFQEYLVLLSLYIFLLKYQSLHTARMNADLASNGKFLDLNQVNRA